MLADRSLRTRGAAATRSVSKRDVRLRRSGAGAVEDHAMCEDCARHVDEPSQRAKQDLSPGVLVTRAHTANVAAWTDLCYIVAFRLTPAADVVRLRSWRSATDSVVRLNPSARWIS
jgi:hypothetical protein